MSSYCLLHTTYCFYSLLPVPSFLLYNSVYRTPGSLSAYCLLGCSLRPPRPCSSEAPISEALSSITEAPFQEPSRKTAVHTRKISGRKEQWENRSLHAIKSPQTGLLLYLSRKTESRTGLPDGRSRYTPELTGS